MRQRGVLDAARAPRGQPERPQTGRVCSTVVHSSIIYGIVPGRFLLPPQRLQVNGQTLEVLSKDGSLWNPGATRELLMQSREERNEQKSGLDASSRPQRVSEPEVALRSSSDWRLITDCSRVWCVCCVRGSPQQDTHTHTQRVKSSGLLHLSSYTEIC